MPKTIEGEEETERGGAELAAEDAAGSEIERAGGDAGPRDRRQQEEGRGAEKGEQIDAAADPRLIGAAMGDERIGGDGEQFVEQEQGEEIGREGDPHRGGDGDREADIERGLPRRLFGAHIADRIDRVDDPQGRGDEGEEHPERLDREGDREPRDDVENGEGRTHAGQDVRKERGHGREQQQRAGKGDRLAKIRPCREQRDQQRRRCGDDKRRCDEEFGSHRRPARSVSAARRARPTVMSVSMPKKIVAAARTSIGTSMLPGGSVAVAIAAFGSRNQAASMTRPT